MSELVKIGISDMKVAKNPDTLVTFALGSCIGICLYDPIMKIGGLGHIMLPKFPRTSNEANKYKYADSCIPIMLERMLKLGCNRSRLIAKIAGGAKMFSVSGDTAFGNIGDRNIIAVKETLSALKIKLLAEDTGLNYGRTVYFHTESGIVDVKSYAKPTKTL